jgi:hypothetical protein
MYLFEIGIIEGRRKRVAACIDGGADWTLMKAPRRRVGRARIRFNDATGSHKDPVVRPRLAYCRIKQVA